MSFQQHLQALRIVAPLYTQMARQKMLSFVPNGKRFLWNINATPPYIEIIDRVRQGGISSLIEFYLELQVASEGPKVLQFSPEKCEALENFTLNVPGEDYHQPFPTTIIELPEDYQKKRIVRAMEGEDLKHQPVCIIMRHEPEASALLVAVAMDSGTTLVWAIKLGEGDLESSWEHGSFDESLPVTKEERVASDRFLRLGMNACLLATDFGLRELGPANKSHYDRVKDRISRAAKRKDHKLAEAGHIELKMIPLRYEIAQEVVLVKQESSADTNGEPTGRVIGPHWRRGHYRMQPYGPGLSLSKRIRIPAVLVNAHLFMGDAGQTTAFYRG